MEVNAVVPPVPKKKRRGLLDALRKHKYIYIMLAPAIICVAVFNYIPLWGWLMAFKNYRVGRGLWGSDWVGFKHFIDFFTANDEWLYLIRNTLVINIVSLVLIMGLSVIFSLLLHELRSRFVMKAVQTASFFPFFVSWVIVYSMANAFLAIDSGALNQFFTRIGIIDNGINFLADDKHSWGLTWFLSVWKNLGYNSIIFLAAISGISPELYEVASIDGAGRFKRVWYITLPGMTSTLIVLLILNSGNVLRSSLDYYFLFTNPMNWKTMEVLDMYIYRYGLSIGNFSYATAVGILLTFVSLILLVGTNALSKKFADKSIL